MARKRLPIIFSAIERRQGPPGSTRPPSYRRTLRRPVKIFLGLIACLGLLAVPLSMVFVDQTETVYLTQFGRPVRVIGEPGLHWKWPYQSRTGLDRRLHLDTPPPREMLTKDKKTLEVGWYVSWRIDDPVRFLKSVRTVSDASGLLDGMAASVLASELAGHDLADLVKVGPGSAVEAFTGDVAAKVSEQAATEFGLKVADLRLRRLNYPEAARAALFERIRSERKREAAAARAEGESQARKVRSAADLERARALAAADSDAARVVGEGEAQAVRISNDAHAVDPSFYQFLKTLETYRAALDTKTTLVLSADSPFLRLLIQGVPDPTAVAPAPPEPEKPAVETPAPEPPIAVTPPPVAPVAPTVVAPVRPTPVAPTTPTPVRPTPARPTTPAPTRPAAPRPAPGTTAPRAPAPGARP